MKKIQILSLITFLMILTSCNSDFYNTKKTINNIITAVTSNNNELLMENAPFTKEYAPEVLYGYKSIWLGIISTKYSVKPVKNSSNPVFVKIQTYDNFNNPKEEYLFSVIKINNSYVLQEDFEITAAKTYIDFIDFRD